MFFDQVCLGFSRAQRGAEGPLTIWKRSSPFDTKAKRFEILSVHGEDNGTRENQGPNCRIECKRRDRGGDNHVRRKDRLGPNEWRRNGVKRILEVRINRCGRLRSSFIRVSQPLMPLMPLGPTNC